MKPLPAVSLASSIAQIVDFSIKVCTQKENKIFQPVDGDSVQNHAMLQDVADNLYRLSLGLEQNELKKVAADPKRGKLSEPAEQLLKIAEQTKELTNPLIDAIIQAQVRLSYGDARFSTIRDALSTVWKKKEITGLKKKLRIVRKEVDVVLLVALKAYLDQSAETGLPVFAEGRNIHQLEHWQNEAMDAIHANSWKPKNKKNVEEFSKQVDKMVQSELEAFFCDSILANLSFTTIDDRLQSISSPHEGTFEWIFATADQDSGHQEGPGLIDWLANTDGQNLFWISGEPGSGKSTLIKFLLRNPRVLMSLENWSRASPGITAGFFFWDAGTEFQKSSQGLLRALLWESLQDMIFGPLQKDPGIVQFLFADRWQQFTSFGRLTHDFTVHELQRAFDLMISDPSKKFFFLVDGLDEVGASFPEAIVDLLVRATKRANVKICTSSRSLLGFQSAFENVSSLKLDSHIGSDVEKVVRAKFDQHEQITKIREQQPESKLESNIIRDIVHKSSNNFLFSKVATEYILQGLGETEDFWAVQRQVDQLPQDLEALILHSFQTLDEESRSQAARIFRLLEANGYPSLLDLSFANEKNVRSSFSASFRPLKEAEITSRVDNLTYSLRTQCRDFLTVFKSGSFSDEENEEDETGGERLNVNWSHRVIKESIVSEQGWNLVREASGFVDLKEDENWANARLWALKTVRPQHSPYGEDTLQIWDKLAWCIEYSLRLEEIDKKVRVTYLDEVGQAAITERQDYIKLGATDLPAGVTPETFLDIASWLNLTGYVSIKAKTSDRKDLRRAVDYHKTLRKRLGDGGAAKWIGDRKKLKAAYDNTTPELFQLMEYYAKPVRFATPKPHVDIPQSI